MQAMERMKEKAVNVLNWMVSITRPVVDVDDKRTTDAIINKNKQKNRQ